MKRNKFAYTGCLLVGMLLASCSNEEEQFSNSEYPLQIESATVSEGIASSRVAENADGTGSQWSDGDKISVRIGDDGKTGTYSLNADGSVKTADTPVYWHSEEAQTITAWYPASDTTIDLSDQTAGLKYVLKATADNKTYSDAVSLDFKHQLAKIRIKLTGDATADVTAVAVKGMTAFSTEQGKVGEATNVGYIKMMKASYTDGEYYEANITPQTISANDFVQITSDGKAYICQMDCDVTTVEAGNAYTFKVVVLTGDKPYADLEKHVLYSFAEGQIAATPDIVTTAMSDNGYLKVDGPISQDDLDKLIYNCKESIVDLDLSEAYGEGLQVKDMAFFCKNTLKSIKLPIGLTKIGDIAFESCENLTSINIPNSVTEIGQFAFYDCVNLTSINIPNNVSEIGRYAFTHCSSLQSINIPDGITKIKSNTFNNCESLTAIDIPNSVTDIEELAFYGCKSLTSITIPDGITKLKNRIFSNCESLTEIVIPNSVTEIGDSVFWHCISLTSIKIPNSVTKIGKATFWGCSSLTSINIPNGVTKIENETFSRCSSLVDITCETITPPICGDEVFYWVNDCTLKVPRNSIDAYKAATTWNSFANIVAIE